LKSAHSVSGDSVAFNIQPRKKGQLLIGSSRQYDIEDDRVEPSILSQMLQRALAYLPTLGSVSAIRVWTGFRPATPDKLPLIGPWRWPSCWRKIFAGRPFLVNLVRRFAAWERALNAEWRSTACRMSGVVRYCANPV